MTEKNMTISQKMRLLTGVVADAAQQHLIEKKLFPPMQKGNCQSNKGTND